MAMFGGMAFVLDALPSGLKRNVRQTLTANGGTIAFALSPSVSTAGHDICSTVALVPHASLSPSLPLFRRHQPLCPSFRLILCCSCCSVLISSASFLLSCLVAFGPIFPLASISAIFSPHATSLPVTHAMSPAPI